MKKIINPWTPMGEEYYNSFACAPYNPFGLKLQFYQDGDDIVGYWDATKNYQSWIGIIHGGIQSTLLDEIAGWVVSDKLSTCGMTTRMNLKYRHSIHVGDHVEIRARLTEMKRNFAFITSELRVNGEITTEAELTYFCVTKEKAAEDFYFHGFQYEDQ